MARRRKRALRKARRLKRRRQHRLVRDRHGLTLRSSSLQPPPLQPHNRQRQYEEQQHRYQRSMLELVSSSHEAPAVNHVPLLMEVSAAQLRACRQIRGHATVGARRLPPRSPGSLQRTQPPCARIGVFAVHRLRPIPPPSRSHLHRPPRRRRLCHHSVCCLSGSIDG